MQRALHHSTLKYLRVAGILCLLSLLIPTLNWVFVLSPFLSSGIMFENELLFRFNIINQIISAITIGMLGVYLLLILKHVGRSASFIALVFKCFEAVLTLVLALFFLIAFVMLRAGSFEGPLFMELLSKYPSLAAVAGIFLGLSMFVFSILFYRSGVIPKWLAGWGILSYALVVINDSTQILSANTWIFFQIIASALVILCQLSIGVYLIFFSQNSTQ